LADLTITGGGIVWYDAAEGGNELDPSTELEVGKSYWAAQTSDNCFGDRIEITITDACLVAYGTVFPFVYTGTDEFDSNFEITVNLHKVPEKGTGLDPVETILFNSTPIYTTTAIYYDGTIFVPGTPKYPGAMGETSNPGLPIDWEQIGLTPGTQNTETLEKGEKPGTPIGLFKFENVKPDEYIIEVSRDGFLVRLGKVEIYDNTTYLNHREILAGDVNIDYMIDPLDINQLKPNFGDTSSPKYKYMHDFNGDGAVGPADLDILIFNLNALMGIYEETLNWASEYE
jgi:hypothetical protein